MKAEEVWAWIDSLVQDIDFDYQGRLGCICPFARDDILLIFNGGAVRVNSVDAAMAEPFIEGHSLEELCEDPEFSI